jgi:adenylate kinase
LVERLLRRGREQGRTDDTEQTIRTRLAIYSQQTAPLIDTYCKRGLLAEVEGLGGVGAVSARILHALTSSGC